MPVVKKQLLSQTVYDTDGVTTQWEFNFSGGYVSTDHVKAYVLSSGTRTDLTVTAGMFVGQYLLQITPALAAGGELTIYRDTPRTQPLVNFQDRGAINEASLDTNAKQSVFVAAEVADLVSRTDLAGAAISAAAAATSAATAAAAASIAGPAATAAANSATAAAASAATINPANFATAAQGTKADTAVQPAGLTAANITDATATGRSVLTAANQAAARTAIGAAPAGSYAASGANGDITSLTALTAGGLPDNSVLTNDIANAAVTPAKLAQPATLATAVATTSGTAIDFTGIPSWVNEVDVIMNAVSTSGAGTAAVLVQLGSGSVQTTGYASYTGVITNANQTSTLSSTAGMLVTTGLAAAGTYTGILSLKRISGNIWVAAGSGGGLDGSGAPITRGSGGAVTLSGALDRIRFTTTNGTDAFDAGSVSLVYRG